MNKPTAEAATGYSRSGQNLSGGISEIGAVADFTGLSVAEVCQQNQCLSLTEIVLEWFKKKKLTK